ncbi:MAG TPA: hypothetical protein VJB16_03185, partial [archaeon]|nr:hypothetical protein [archaeon]
MLAQREYHRLRGERERIDAATQAVRAQEQQLQQQLQAQEAALSQRRVELEAVEQQHAEQRAQALQAAHLIDVAQRQIQTNQERMAEGRRRRAQAEQEIDTLRQQLAQTAAQIDELRRAIEATDAQRQTLESSMAAAQEGIAACEATIQRAQEAIRERKQSIVESAAQASRLRNDLTRLSSQVHGAQARLQRLELESGRVTVEQDAVSDQTARLEAELTEVRELTERLMADRQQRMAELETARLQVMEGDQQLTEAQQSLVAIESRHEILQGLVASHEGMSSGVKALLDGFRRQALGDEGIIGILADALQVEPGYEAAVEAALGELAQAIVVEHWGAAASCLVYLQQHNAGRVTILVRSAVQSGSRGAEAPVGPYELVISRVRTEPALRPLLDRLLEQAYVVPDLKTALEFQRTAIVPIRLVTLQGERVTGTSITGGSNLTADSTLVGRHQRLTQVTAELEAARERARLARLQTDEALAVEHALQTALEEADRHSQAQRTTLAQRETQYASLCQALNKLNEEQSLLKVEADEAREQRTEAQGQEGTVQTSLTELEGQLEREQAAIVDTQQQIEAATRQREQDAITLAEAKTQLASVEPMRMGRQHSLGLLEQSLQGMQSTITA